MPMNVGFYFFGDTQKRLDGDNE